MSKKQIKSGSRTRKRSKICKAAACSQGKAARHSDDDYYWQNYERFYAAQEIKK